MKGYTRTRKRHPACYHSQRNPTSESSNSYKPTTNGFPEPSRLSLARTFPAPQSKKPSSPTSAIATQKAGQARESTPAADTSTKKNRSAWTSPRNCSGSILLMSGQYLEYARTSWRTPRSRLQETRSWRWRFLPEVTSAWERKSSEEQQAQYEGLTSNIFRSTRKR